MKLLFAFLLLANLLNFTDKDGLSANMTVRFCQTSYGVMWLGTENGLTRFDGSHFKIFRTMPGDSTSLSDNFVTSFAEDPDGRHLWVGTMNGLCRMDMVSGRFERFRSKALQGNIIRALLVDSKGRLWVMNCDKACHYMAAFDFDNGQSYGRSFEVMREGNYYHYSIVEDSDQRIWAVGRLGERSLLFIESGHMMQEQHIYSKQVLSAAVLSREGNIIAASSMGVVSYNLSGKEYQMISSADSSAIAMSMDSKGNIYTGGGKKWILYKREASGEDGKVRYSPQTAEITEGNILCLYCDRDDNLWIGTDKGVSMLSPKRNSIRHFSQNPNSVENRISSNSVTALMLDRDSTLWIGTEQYGVDTINLHTGAHGNIKYTLLTPNLDSRTAQKEADNLKMYRTHKLSGPRNENKVSSLYQDSRGTIYIGLWSHVGFNTYDKRTREIKRHCLWGIGPPNSWIYYIPIPTNAFGANWYSGFLEDSRGRMWCATWEGYGLNLFDRDEEGFTYKHYLQRHIPDKFNSASNLKLYFDRTLRRLYIGGGNYYGYYDMSKKEYFRYIVDYPPFFETEEILSGYIANSPNLINSGIKKDTPPSEIYLANDSRGNNWIATFDGLFKHNLHEDSFSIIYTDYSSYPSSINNSSTDAIGFYYIKDDTLYHQTYAEGIVSKLLSGQLRKLDFPRSIIFDAGNDTLYIGMTLPGKGLYILNKRSGDLDSVAYFSDKSLRHIDKDAQGRLYVSTEEGAYMISSDKSIHPLTSFHTAKTLIENDKLWLCTQNGLMVINRKDSSSVTFRNDGSAPWQPASNLVDDILRYDDSTLFVSIGSCIQLLDERTGRFSDLAAPDPHSLTSRLASCLMESSHGDIWYGTTENGLSILNISADTIRSFRHLPYDTTSLPDNWVTDIHEDPSGSIWVGTVRGLCRYDARGQCFRRTPSFEGKSIKRILSDREGNLWVSTIEGLYMYNEARTSIRAYHSYLGLQGEEYTSAACAFADGHLAFGGNNGFDIFLPSEINADAAPRPIVVSGLPQGIASKRDVAMDESIVLRYRDNDISFEFASTDYAFAQNLHYRYRLGGYEKDWTWVESRQLSARYTNIPSGRYTLEIEATNRFGEWCEVVKSIPLRIKTPLLLRWYFIAAYLLLIFLSFRVLILLRERKLKEEKIALEKIVNQRTSELAHEVETRNRFFSIISHDLKNPVAAIGMLSGLLTEQYSHLADDKRIEVISSIHESYTHASDLINAIVLWASSQQKLIKPVITHVNLHHVCEEIIGLNCVNLSSKEITVRNLVPQDFVLECDKNMISTILRNLVSNAIKFSYRGGEIEICATPGPGFTISVSDHGTGMTQETLDALFRIDTKLHKQGTESEKGLGLGLIIVKEFIDRLEWHIHVSSLPGLGSRFEISDKAF